MHDAEKALARLGILLGRPLQRIDEAGQRRERRPQFVAGIGDEIGAHFLDPPQRRQVAIEIDLPETPVTIAGDREELLRLFENLIENALKYGASGGRVIVSLTQATSGEGAPEVRIMVRDFGPGIAPEHLPRLTERFYRVDVGDSRAQGGTGLGLSLVKHILNRHRGRLLIESVPKNGAVFTACFPQAKTPPAQ